MDEAGGSGVITTPLRLEELFALRSDFEDVVVPSLGGRTFRVYALSGLARAKLVPLMADLASRRDADSTKPVVIATVFEYQYKSVAASLGYPEEQWDDVGALLGSEVVELLYAVVARLSGLAEQAVDEAASRLGRARKRGSGTGSPSLSATGPSESAS